MKVKLKVNVIGEDKVNGQGHSWGGKVNGQDNDCRFGFKVKLKAKVRVNV